MGRGQGNSRSNKGGGGGGGSNSGTEASQTPSLPEVNRTFENVSMSPLQGSEKQVAWAEKIRDGLVSKRSIEEAEARYNDMKKSGNDTAFERDLLSLRYKVENTIKRETAKMTSAKDLIERRKDGLRSEILKRNLKNLDSEFLRKTFPKPSDFLRWAA